MKILNKKFFTLLGGFLAIIFASLLLFFLVGSGG